MNKFLAIGMVTLLLIVGAAAPASAAQGETCYLEKVCADQTVNWCVLQNGTGPLAALNGGKVYYIGPNLGTVNPHGFLHVSSNVYLEDASGTRLLDGHFIFVGDHGYFIFYNGADALDGLHAQGMMGADWETATFSLEGTCRFEGK